MLLFVGQVIIIIIIVFIMDFLMQVLCIKRLPWHDVLINCIVSW